MTPLRNDVQNPFERQAPWMPQAPLGFQRMADGSERSWPSFQPLTLGRPDEDDRRADEGFVWFDSCPEAAEPAFADQVGTTHDLARPAPGAPRRSSRRLTPLLGATAVGVGGLLALFLLIGVGPDPSAAANAATDLTSPIVASAQTGH